jgi:biopolymer transport protein ExbB/TolQ
MDGITFACMLLLLIFFSPIIIALIIFGIIFVKEKIENMNAIQKFFAPQYNKSETFRFIKKLYPSVKFIDTNKNWGFKLGCRTFEVNGYLEVTEKCLNSDYFYKTKLATKIEDKLLDNAQEFQQNRNK